MSNHSATYETRDLKRGSEHRGRCACGLATEWAKTLDRAMDDIDKHRDKEAKAGTLVLEAFA